MPFKNTFITIIALAIPALAQQTQSVQTVYGLCGGLAWDGPTICAAGSYCSVLNKVWYQCLPGTPTSTPPPATSAPAATLTTPLPTITPPPV
ncbi:hypothetical protein CPB84DRAFT_1845285 [Gymnopilus junonius]|uniref:CBM1 domain-containing protein n=1 Tax=Gymnopilus junonius TaxID=109634 RepID=A0A9P5NTD9_GYMJU|nr:hypothetical protein CPB84DRAFT_1845285 [Gymnopilus junonius]